MKMKIKIRPIVSVLCVTIALLITSCVDGFKENELFSSGVTGVTLESPNGTTVVFTPNAEGTSVKISWPVVYGAGGYQFSLYKVDDPSNPIAVGKENEIVDGCSVTRDLEEDTKYKVVVKTLGNAEYSNKEAAAATEALYNTLLPTTAVIPAGTDLSAYFAANPIPSTATELAYQLEAGGSYTMNANVPLPLTKVTIRGDKVHHPVVTMTGGTFLSDGAGFKLKFIDFDCSGFTGTSLITYNATQNAGALLNTWVTVTSPVAVQSCNIKGLAKYFLWDSNKKYALQNLLIKDCVISQNSINQYFIYMQGGIIKDLTISNSTISNAQVSTANFIQYNAAVRVTTNVAWNWSAASVNVINSTFWQVAKAAQMANYAGFGLKGNTLTVLQCIFVDCGSQAVIRRLSASTNVTRTLKNNSYWFGGVFATAEISASYDNSGTHITTDPLLKDPANGDFTVGGVNQISARTGDPRWLPAQ